MTYIEQFLSQHIISYYLSSVRTSKDHRSFTDHRSTPNFFSLTWEILLFGENIAKTNSRTWLAQLIAAHLRIPYDQLRHSALPPHPSDSPSIALIKTSFPYVHVQMHQIMIRIILAHLAIADSGAISEDVEREVREIGYIYPALKAEISFGTQDINLAEWLEHYLTQLIKEKSPNPTFYQFLERVKTQCNFMGPIQRLFQKLAMYQDADDQKTREKQFESKEKQYECSIYEESRSESVSKLSQDKIFNDLELFRKKKKILKDRYKTTNFGSSSFVTPTKHEIHLPLPDTDKASSCGRSIHEESAGNSQTGSSAFSKLLKKYKKPMVRTIYQGSTKTFVPKRPIGVNGYSADEYIENITASSSLASSESLFPFEVTRKLSSKLSRPSFQTHQGSEFYVPETPKQEPLRKASTVQGRKGMGLLKI